jgi:hypothetical protein
MVRNILAVIAGVLSGSVVNMVIVMVGTALIPLPDPNYQTPLEAKNVIFPFAAHAVGTLVGSWVASAIAVSHRFKISIGIGVFFLLGGIAAVAMIAAPLWFEAADLILAYIPMAWLGWKIAGGKS